MKYTKIRKMGIRLGAASLGMLVLFGQPAAVLADTPDIVASSSQEEENPDAAAEDANTKDAAEDGDSQDSRDEMTETDKENPDGAAEQENSDSEQDSTDDETASDSDEDADLNSEKEDETKEDSEKKSEDKKENSSDASKEAQEENKEKEEQTNEELIAQQHIVHVEPVQEDFRFRLVDREIAFTRVEALVLEDMKDDARGVGQLPEKGVVFVLEKLTNGWLFVESGPVRGYIKEEALYRGKEAEQVTAAFSKKAGEKAMRERTTATASDFYQYAQILVPVRENQAYYASLATTYDRVIEKEYALVSGADVTVYEDKTEESRAVGKLYNGYLAYVIADGNQNWVYIESGDVRGFVKKEFLSTGEEVDAQIAEKGEETYAQAAQLVNPEDNAALYYTTTSIKQGSKNNPIRKAILKTAEECIGNPYVWGGTSLTSGADCSGFVQTLFGLYGISLPRVAEHQALYGTQIPVSEAAPGDLIFFAMDGYVYHVALYIGNGQTIEAYNDQVGIIRYTVDMEHAVWATRVLSDEN